MHNWPNTHMHTSNRYTHKTGGAYMHTNGGDRRSGPIPHGGAREKGMEVTRRARATIFPTGCKEQENAKQAEEQ